MAQRPWYYVPGRKDLTEKRIARRREKEAIRERVNLSNANYFNKLDAQVKVHKQWEKKRSLMKTLPSEPYGGDFMKPDYSRVLPKVPSERVEKEIKQKRFEVQNEFSKLIQEARRREIEAEKLNDDEVMLVMQLKQLYELKVSMLEKCQVWSIKENKLAFVRFARDRLRKKVFLLCDQLNSYKVVVEFMQQINIGGHLLSEQELEKVNEVSEGALKIIDMYLQLNQTRDSEFQLLFQ